MAYTEFRKNDFIDISSKEWLVSNGAGGYASASICGSNTRKYHGLLVAALNPPTNRQVLVSKIEEAILGKGHPPIEISSNQYPGSVSPQGYRYLESFKRSPLPASVFKSSDFALEKTVFMPYGYNATIVEYKNIGDNEITLRLNPLFLERDYHNLFHENHRYNYHYELTKKGLKIYSHHGAKPLFWNFTKGGFQEQRFWFKNLEYLQELERGLEFKEDCYHLGYITCDIKPNDSVYMVFTLDEVILDKSPEQLKAAEIKRLNDLVPKNVTTEFYKDLIVSVDQFIVHRKSTECFSIIAGYHWFTDWGRDTMISLLGATIALGKKAETTSIMSTFLKYLDKGMIPNRFPDREHEEPEYNTVDGTLWFFIAVYEYYQKFKDEDYLKTMHPFLGDILRHHVQGTRYHIHATEQGFLWAGDASTQLTWMDARINDYVVTPRFGCPVEINALWYNALKIYEFITQKTQQQSVLDTGSLIQQFNSNFETAFWNKEGYLNDVYFENGKYDDAIRPNQLYAVSLPFPLVDKEKQKKICKTVEKHLLTPLGLRSLSPEHPLFRPLYGGNQWERDTAYHQGTIWAFLIGEYMLALLTSNDYSDESKKKCVEIIDGFKDHFYKDSGIHCISEIFDGLQAKDGKGCIQQAWSVASLLRVLDKINLL